MRQLPVEIERVRRGSTDLGNLQLTIDYLENDGWRFQDIEGNFLGVQWLPSTYIAWRAEGGGYQPDTGRGTERHSRFFGVGWSVADR